MHSKVIWSHRYIKIYYIISPIVLEIRRRAHCLVQACIRLFILYKLTELIYPFSQSQWYLPQGREERFERVVSGESVQVSYI